MLALQQLRELIEGYGADPRRWPPQLHAAAQALLRESPQARALLEEARTLDAALEAASREADRRIWHADSLKDAALARLRARVAARTASSHWRATPQAPLRWLALAAAAAMAIYCGFLVGSLSAPAATSPQDNLLTALQPVPVHMLEH
jgi:hypothetical protein